jgi:hypothetical protein
METIYNQKGENFNDRIKHWMTNSNHNFQRIARILKFLKLMDMENYSLLFFKELEKLYKNRYKNIIGKYTYDYWNNAATGNKEINESYKEELLTGSKIMNIWAIIIGIIIFIILIIRIVKKI